MLLNDMNFSVRTANFRQRVMKWLGIVGIANRLAEILSSERASEAILNSLYQRQIASERIEKERFEAITSQLAEIRAQLLRAPVSYRNTFTADSSFEALQANALIEFERKEGV